MSLAQAWRSARRRLAVRTLALLAVTGLAAGTAAAEPNTDGRNAAPLPAASAAVTVLPKARGLTPCTALEGAFLHARMAGTLELVLDFRGADLSCDGMRRPDGKGLRVSFAGALGDEHLTLVFGVPHLAEGASGRAVPVNVTIIRDGGRVYGTRGEGKCVLDEVVQTPMAAPVVPVATMNESQGGPAVAQAAALDSAAPRRWRIDARGFCLEPARAVAAGSIAGDAILLTTFDFRGPLAWEPDLPEAPPGKDPVRR